MDGSRTSCSFRQVLMDGSLVAHCRSPANNWVDRAKPGASAPSARQAVTNGVPTANADCHSLIIAQAAVNS